MSLTSQSKIVRLPYPVSLSAALSAKDQHAALPLLHLLSVDSATDRQVYDSAQLDTLPITLPIEKFVDGRGLACPMPLLKTQVASLCMLWRLILTLKLTLPLFANRANRPMRAMRWH